MYKFSHVIVGLLGATVAFSALAALEENGIAMDIVVLGALDKVTTRVNTLKGLVGTPVKFGMLEIVAQTCVTTPPEDPPESAAFMEIYQVQEGEEEQQVFSGWMFASSPALSALDHPVYDVWVLGCEASTPSSSP
jgi:hypothetical protein